MAPASTINFLSNEDTQELAPGFFIVKPAKVKEKQRAALSGGP
jgi:hypothetical protein